MLYNDHPLKGWIPYKLFFYDGKPLIHWLYTSDIPFVHPFFEESIARCKSHKFNSSSYRCVSSLESMIEWSNDLPKLPLVTLLFHISRCGSTMLSQLIGLNDNYTVLAEVPFFDDILRLQNKMATIEDGYIEKLLDASVKFVGQNKHINKEHLFIKTDSWHILFYNRYRKIFPNASTVLLYRTPDEVLYSHQKLAGMQAVPMVIEPEVFGFNKQDVLEMPQDIYTAKVLEKYMLMFDQIKAEDQLALLLNYNQGAKNMIEQIGEHLNLQWEDVHLKQMQHRNKFHSKHPQQNFVKESKKENIPDCLIDAMKVYTDLDEKRVCNL